MNQLVGIDTSSDAGIGSMYFIASIEGIRTAMNDVVNTENRALVTEQAAAASLHGIDTLRGSPHTDIGDARVTNVAHAVINYDPEAMIWQDTTSPSVLLPNLFKWIFIFTIWAFVAVFMMPKTISTIAETAAASNESTEAHGAKKQKPSPKGEGGQANAKNKKTEPAPV